MSKKAPKNKLAPLRIKAESKPVKTGDVIQIFVDGDYPTRYNEASAIAKEADALMKEFKPVFCPQAQEEVYRNNCEKPWEPVSSVAMRDVNDNVLRVSFLNKFASVDVPEAELLFDQIKIKAKDGQPAQKPDINDYLQFVVVSTFDMKALINAEGKFDQARFKMFHEAIQKVADDLKVPNPLSTAKEVVPKPSFAARRWVDFDFETNQKIGQVIKQQVNCVPCPNAVTNKMVGEKEEKEEA